MQQAVKSIPLQEVQSSQIHAIGHDKETNTLAIQFKSWKGEVKPSVYHYANFTCDQFDAFSKAESLGTHFGQHIKKETEKHPFTKIDLEVPVGQQ